MYFEQESGLCYRFTYVSALLLPFMLTDYLRFLRSPTYAYQNHPVRWGDIFVLILLYLLIGYVLNPLFERLADHFQLKHALEDSDTTIMILGVVLIPPLEEITFRLWLRVNRSTLFAVAFLILFIGLILLPMSQLGAVLLMALSVVILVLTLMGYEEDIERLVARRFGLFFYGSTVLFALMHITNFTPLNAQTLLLAPLLVMPQFIVGTMLGYTRVRYGIGYAILFHVLVNAVLFALIAYFPS